MSKILNLFILFISKTHTKILTLNDTFGWAMSDKWLHFFVIGIFGLCMLIAIQPLFKWLATHEGTILITFIYVFTVVLVVTFAIEIGQAYSGTGDMDKYDIASGIAGFFVFFGIYLVGYLIYKNRKEKQASIEEKSKEYIDEEPIKQEKRTKK